MILFIAVVWPELKVLAFKKLNLSFVIIRSGEILYGIFIQLERLPTINSRKGPTNEALKAKLTAAVERADLSVYRVL